MGNFFGTEVKWDNKPKYRFKFTPAAIIIDMPYLWLMYNKSNNAHYAEFG